MAKKVKNEKGFLVLEITRGELLDALAEYGSIGICDSCGLPVKKGYYIAVLNQWFCEDCYEEWLTGATRYVEDIPYEEKWFEHYCRLFDVSY